MAPCRSYATGALCSWVKVDGICSFWFGHPPYPHLPVRKFLSQPRQQLSRGSWAPQAGGLHRLRSDSDSGELLRDAGRAFVWLILKLGGFHALFCRWPSNLKYGPDLLFAFYGYVGLKACQGLFARVPFPGERCLMSCGGIAFHQRLSTTSKLYAICLCSHFSSRVRVSSQHPSSF